MHNDLAKSLAKHRKWLLEERGGERLVLQNANLSGMDLRGADLRGADLPGADLQGADLRLADLRFADLRGTNLEGANLSYAQLQGSLLLRANMRGANLQEANLRGTHFMEVNLEGAKLPDFQKMPETGLIIGWKKVSDGITLMLEITGQRTCTLTSNVCRCSEAKVLEAFTLKGTHVQGITKFRSCAVPTFFYELGKVVRVPDYDGDIRVPGAPGIHFFLNRKDAEDYYG